MDDLFQLHPDGVFLRREALDRGYDDRDLARGRREGAIARVRHGAYVDAQVFAAADDVARHVLAAQAVIRSHGTSLVLSHTTAAAAHGLALYEPDLRRVHVMCPECKVARTTKDVVYHAAQPQSWGDPVLIDGMPVVRPVHAAVQAALLTNTMCGLVVVDSVMHLKDVVHAEVEAMREEYRHVPGSRRLQMVTRLAREGAESPGETISRFLMHRHGIPEPLLQYEVRDVHGNLLGFTDFGWPDSGLLGEFDGKGKYLTSRRKGETIEQCVMREKTREDAIREATHCMMIRMIWADFYRPDELMARIRRALEAGKRSLGAA